ncbi:unnamed protein product [Trichogramma brassicae]|uniref:Uncharacterized protein n=1 Tax=Trichogramma brassicae TaxID=86971 RepID=A0A6H5I2C5_9HYME|nr:unnamed protein product [Trichogramma brassicae]
MLASPRRTLQISAKLLQQVIRNSWRIRAALEKASPPGFPRGFAKKSQPPAKLAPAAATAANPIEIPAGTNLCPSALWWRVQPRDPPSRHPRPPGSGGHRAPSNPTTAILRHVRDRTPSGSTCSGAPSRFRSRSRVAATGKIANSAGEYEAPTASDLAASLLLTRPFSQDTGSTPRDPRYQETRGDVLLYSEDSKFEMNLDPTPRGPGGHSCPYRAPCSAIIGCISRHLSSIDDFTSCAVSLPDPCQRNFSCVGGQQ